MPQRLHPGAEEELLVIVHVTNEEHELLKHAFNTDKVTGRHLVTMMQSLQDIITVAVEPREQDQVNPDDSPESDADEAAWLIMRKVRASEPGQFDIIEETIKMKGITPWQYLVGLLLRCGEMFELGNPREVRDYIETGDTLELPHTACPSCSKDFQMVRMGQVYCSNACGSWAEKMEKKMKGEEARV